MLAHGGVGGDHLVPPPVGLLERIQLGAGMRSFPPHDQPHPDRPPIPERPGHESGDLGDLRAVAQITAGVDCGGPGVLGQSADGVPDRVGDGEPDRILHRMKAFGVLGGEPVQQGVRGAGAIDTDQQIPAAWPGHLHERRRQHRNMVDGRIGPGVAGSELDRQEFTGVVTPTGQRVIPEPLS